MISYHAHLAEFGGDSYSRLFTASILTPVKEKASEACAKHEGVRGEVYGERSEQEVFRFAFSERHYLVETTLRGLYQWLQ